MRMDRRFVIVLGVSLAWALVVTAIFTRLARGGRSAASTVTEKPLVVAVRALPLGSVLTRDAVKLRNVPERLFPAGGFSRVEEVEERPVISAIQPEEPVIEARIAPRGSGVGLAPLIPPGMRAISVRVNDVVGVAGFVLPGMRVDVLVTGKPTNVPDTATRTVLQNVAVLSAGQTIQTDGKSAISTPVVTLLVTPEDAEALTLANNDGHIQLVLRNSSDERLANPRGRRWSELYGYRGVEAAPEPRPARRVPVHETPKPEPRPQPVAAPVPAAPPVVEAVTVIRGSVKTTEPAAQGGAK